MASERREFQRLRLAKPILALLDGQNALILDIGVGGAMVEHYGIARARQRFKLLFRWKANDVAFHCEVRRTTVMRGSGDTAVSHSGIRFVDAIGDADARLQDMMATFVGRLLAAQKLNASGNRGETEAVLVQLGGARRARSRGFVMYTHTDGKWWREPTDSPEQPQ